MKKDCHKLNTLGEGVTKKGEDNPQFTLELFPGTTYYIIHRDIFCSLHVDVMNHYSCSF